MYRVDSDVDDQVAELSEGARAAFDEARAVLEQSPWEGEPVRGDNPAGQARFLPLSAPEGSGLVVYVIVEHARQVVVVDLVWAALPD